MSFTTGGGTAIFPKEWIKKCIATYTEDHDGKAPKVLVISDDDWIDYNLNLTIHGAKDLGVQVVRGSYLKVGEIDLAMGIKEEEDK